MSQRRPAPQVEPDQATLQGLSATGLARPPAAVASTDTPPGPRMAAPQAEQTIESN